MSANEGDGRSIMRIKKLAGLVVAAGLVIGITYSGVLSTGPSSVLAVNMMDSAATNDDLSAESEVPDESQAPEEATEAPAEQPGTIQMADDTVIADGVFIGEFDLSGMTKAEALEMIRNHVETLRTREISINISGNKEAVEASALGFEWTNPEAVDIAAALGTQGSLINRYKTLKDLEAENQVIPLDLSYNDEQILNFVTEACAKYDVPAKNATLTRGGGGFSVTPEVVGMETNKEQTAAELAAAIRGDSASESISVEAIVQEVQPSRTAEALSQVKDVIGTYTTKYNQGNVGRSKNLSTGARKINGIVLMPGETFSGYDVMAPFTVSNGYAAAGAYQNGVVIESVGGGACQIATTIYNTLLLAELEVTQRQNHSMIVSYVPYSFDAAIAGTYKDIKFRNNLEYPIYLECSASSGRMTFTVYGKETRPSNRSIRYESVTLSESWPSAPQITEDPNLPAGTQHNEQGAYPAVSSQLWKYVYVDGVQTEKTMIHQDRYNSSPARVTVGVGAAPEVPVEGAPADAPVEGTPETPAPETPAPETPAPETPAPETPAPEEQQPEEVPG